MSNGSAAAAARNCGCARHPSRRRHRLLPLLYALFGVVILAGATCALLAASEARRAHSFRHLLPRYDSGIPDSAVGSSSDCQRCIVACSDGKPALNSPDPGISSSAGLANDSIHRRVYEFSCLGLNPCSATATPTRPKLAVLVVASSPPNGARRDAIRLTWANEAPRRGMSVVFLVGLAANNRTNQAVGEEALRYGDLIVANFVDSYGALTLKSIAMVKWAATFCREWRYLAKVDDDVFVSLSGLEADLLRYADVGRAIIGARGGGGPVITKPGHKWANPYYLKNYGPIYQPYIRGLTYFVSMDIVPELFEASQSVPFDPMEDVFLTGICASKIGNVTLIGHAGIKSFSSSVTYLDVKDAIAMHPLQPSEMLAYWTRQTTPQPRPPLTRPSV